jgi:signal transduction histidine kinase
MTGPDDAAELERLRRRLERERRARTESERIAEKALRALYTRQREIALLETIAAAANATSGFEEAVQVTLDAVCKHTGWPVAHAYLVSGDTGGALVSTRVWHLDSPERFEVFRAASEARVFPLGVGLPGRVLASRRPAWISDVTRDPNFPRSDAAAAVGLRAAFGFPVLVGAEVAAVLEFYSVTLLEPDEPLLDVMAQIGTQLGRVIERQRAEHAVRALHQTEKVAAMGSLLAGVAHELNNPLTIVTGQAALLREGLLDGELAARAEKIEKAAERCARIVRNFLALARQRPQERRTVALNVVVSEAMELLAYQARVAEVDVDLRLAPELPPLFADPHQLHQVVLNLASNGLQAMADTPPPRRLTLATAYDEIGDVMVLEVSDTGPGVPPDLEARIFEPFFTTKAVGTGTGLGLSLCQGIVESHGGRLRLERRPGQGATFVVELPHEAVAAEPEPDEEVVEDRRPMTGRRILVVEDETAVAEILADVIRLEGHAVEIVENGRRALEKLQHERYDLIISDLRMPELDGPGLWHEVQRRHPELAHRFVFVTGDSLRSETREFVEHVPLPTLSKPFLLGEVRKVLATVFGGH